MSDPKIVVGPGHKLNGCYHKPTREATWGEIEDQFGILVSLESAESVRKTWYRLGIIRGCVISFLAFTLAILIVILWWWPK